jgi:hypothetical protein
VLELELKLGLKVELAMACRWQRGYDEDWDEKMNTEEQGVCTKGEGLGAYQQK